MRSNTLALALSSALALAVFVICRASGADTGSLVGATVLAGLLSLSVTGYLASQAEAAAER